jgi:antitoxin (DNA-binding transcriptional repressor) of toxin-antitoxin stability system
MKATATDLARDTSHILSVVQAGRTVEIVKHGKVFAVIKSVRAGSGRKLLSAMDRLSKKDRLALKDAMKDARKAVPGGWS